MAEASKHVAFIQKWEGKGFTNDPLDIGGATMQGITFNTFRAYRALRGMPAPTLDDLKAITPAEWYDCYKALFWDVCMADTITSQPVANLVVDFYWHSGLFGVKEIQKVLHVNPDGVLGKTTRDAINAQQPYNLFMAIQAARKQFLNDLAENSVKQYTKNHPNADKKELLQKTQLRFLQGWLNRVNDLKYIVQ